jgi:hypothetical protein
MTFVIIAVPSYATKSRQRWTLRYVMKLSSREVSSTISIVAATPRYVNEQFCYLCHGNGEQGIGNL